MWKYHHELKGAIPMDDNRVAVLLEDLLSKFRTFGEGQEVLSNEVHEIKQKVDGLIEDMDIVKPTLKSMDNRLNSVETRLNSVETRLNSVEVKLNSVETRLNSIDLKTDGLTEDMDIVKPTLIKINNRLDNIEGEIIKFNPESRSVIKQVK